MEAFPAASLKLQPNVPSAELGAAQDRAACLRGLLFTHSYLCSGLVVAVRAKVMDHHCTASRVLNH